MCFTSNKEEMICEEKGENMNPCFSRFSAILDSTHFMTLLMVTKLNGQAHVYKLQLSFNTNRIASICKRRL